MSIRIYSRKVLTPAKEFTISMLSRLRWRARSSDNSLLSHDLFEGIFARVALATDIELFDEFPSRYEAVAARQHRWARGDWQLLPWLLGRRYTGPGKRNQIRIPTIGRWKILDNLRRTLSAPAAFLTLVAGWFLSHSSPWPWTLFILATVAIPSILRLIGLIPRRKGIFCEAIFAAYLGIWLSAHVRLDCRSPS